jgi:PAS domain S-box-containing protein
LWSAQTQKIRNSITALQEYNVLNLTEILNTFRKIGERLGEIILLLSAVVILSIFALFYYLRQTITLPIVKLSNYVDEISEKNFSNIVDDEVVRKDEIGALFKAFINLSRRLKNSYNQLEKKVQERTIELSNRTTELENTQKATLNILEDLNAERATLLETQALDSAILASIGDALVVIDTEGVITYVNQSFESITGWKSEEVKGKVFVDIIPSESEKGLPTPNKERFITKIISGENPENDYTSTAYYKRKDGSRFPVSSVVRRILLNDKQIGAVKTFSDITRMRDIDKAKSEFVSLAAHQLRTPLSAISWYTEMLLSGDAGDISDLQKRYLEQIYQGNQRMIAMVKSFLDVSRIEMGFLLLNKEQVQVNKLLENVIEEQQQKLKSKNIALELEYEQDIPTIRLDREKMFMVFQNLLSNAIKYTPEGGKITITATQNKPEQSLLIKISDTGFGIPEEAKEKIFSKLYRAQNVVEKATAGTGLGLYIVKNIVDNSGGKIWFESEEHKGTTFFLQLPML